MGRSDRLLLRWAEGCHVWRRHYQTSFIHSTMSNRIDYGTLRLFKSSSNEHWKFHRIKESWHFSKNEVFFQHWETELKAEGKKASQKELLDVLRWYESDIKKYGKTKALTSAFIYGDMLNMTLLKVMSFNFTSKDRFLRTPLMYAALNTTPDVWPYIVNKGVKINSVDIFGRMAIHYAVLEQNIPMIEFLLRMGVKSDRRDHFYRTPLKYAMLEQFHDIVKLLILHKNGEIGPDRVDLRHYMMHFGRYDQEFIELLEYCGLRWDDRFRIFWRVF